MNLAAKPPKIITLYFEYKSYFDNVGESGDDPFVTRPQLVYLLSERFNMSELFLSDNSSDSPLHSSVSQSESLFDYDSEDFDYQLYGIVGYYGFHYMAFVRLKSLWYLCEDTKNKELGNFNKLLEYIEKCKIIPYLVFYEQCNNPQKSCELDPFAKEEEKSFIRVTDDLGKSEFVHVPNMGNTTEDLNKSTKMLRNSRNKPYDIEEEKEEELLRTQILPNNCALSDGGFPKIQPYVPENKVDSTQKSYFGR